MTRTEKYQALRDELKLSSALLKAQYLNNVTHELSNKMKLFDDLFNEQIHNEIDNVIETYA